MAECSSSYDPTLPRRNLPCHRNLRCTRLPSTVESLVKRAGKPSPCFVLHHSSIGNWQSHSNSRVVATSPITPKLHSVDDLQWQPATRDLRTRVGSCWHCRGHPGSDTHHLEPRRSRLESVIRRGVLDRVCNSDRGLEGNVCGKSRSSPFQLHCSCVKGTAWPASSSSPTVGVVRWR